MRMILLMLTLFVCGIGLTVALARGSVAPERSDGTGPERPPNYSLAELLAIFSERKVMDDRKARQEIVHATFERLLADLWAQRQSLPEAAQQLHELSVSQSPDYHAGIVSMFPATSEEEAYARCILQVLYVRWSERTRGDRSAGHAHIETLLAQFRKQYRADMSLGVSQDEYRTSAAPLQRSDGSELRLCCP